MYKSKIKIIFLRSIYFLPYYISFSIIFGIIFLSVNLNHYCKIDSIERSDELDEYTQIKVYEVILLVILINAFFRERRIE